MFKGIMTSTGIAIVSTQMQLMNVVEAIQQNSIGRVVLIVCGISKSRVSQVKYLLQKKEYRNFFSRIYYFNFFFKGFQVWMNLGLFYITIKFLSYFKFEYCLFSNYWEPLHRYFQYVLESSGVKSIIVDDGTGMMQFAVDRNKELNTGIPATRLSSRSYKVLFGSKLGNYIPKSIHFFSIYPLELSKCDTFQENKYTFLRSKSALLFPENKHFLHKVIVLGETLVQENLVPFDSYNNYLDQIHNFFKDKELIYLSHPGEITESLNEANKQVYEKRKSTISFEMIGLTLDEDSVVVSFCSSALSNLVYLGARCQLYSIMLKEIEIMQNSDKERMTRMYNYFHNIGIPFLPIT